MKIKFTPAHLQARPEVMSTLLAKLADKMEWDSGDLSRAEIQFCLDNNIKIDNAVLYSPVVGEGVLNALAPANWPGVQTLDEEGEVASHKTYGEFFRTLKVDGGYVLQFAGGLKDSNNNIRLPNNQQLRVQINAAGGFLTQEEIDALIITEEVVE